MTDKELDEIMKQYVVSTSAPAEEGLRKLRSAEIVNNNSKKVAKRKRPIWLLIATTLTIVLVLSIALPLTLNKDVPNTPIIYQVTSNDIGVIKDSNIDQLNEYEELLLPTVENINTSTSVWSLKESDRIIGAEQNLDIFDDYLESISFTLLEKEYHYNAFDRFYNFAQSVTWKSIIINFETESDIYGFIYNTYMYFEYGKYNYYLSVVSYEEISVIALMDMIY